MDSGKL